MVLDHVLDLLLHGRLRLEDLLHGEFVKRPCGFNVLQRCGQVFQFRLNELACLLGGLDGLDLL